MIKMLSSGFYTSVQDLGRLDHQEYGVPISGAMDRYAANMANVLVNNDADQAVLEITLTGPKLQFNCDSVISITGANMSPLLNNKPLLINSAVNVAKGDTLLFGKLIYGCRAYLAIKGGFQTELVMHSRSMYKGITSKIKVEKGDELEINTDNSSFGISHASVKADKDRFSTKELKVFKGPEYDMLSAGQQKQVFENFFTIAKENSRMAYQLTELLPNDLMPIITSLVLPGTVQLTPSGKLIVLMRDCQTTGGYPRILQLSEDAINILAQKFTNEKIKFKLIN